MFAIVAAHAHNFRRPHRRKQRIPPGPAALVAAEQLRGAADQPSQTVIDLAAYAAAAENRKTLP